MKKPMITIVVVAVAVVTAAMPAYAYIDPGAGTLIVQAIIGGVAAALTIGGIYSRKIREWVKRVLGRYFGKKAEDQRP